MCIVLQRSVIRLDGSNAVLDDGRTVRIGSLQDIQVGDSLEVYGDIALGKLKKQGVGLASVKEGRVYE